MGQVLEPVRREESRVSHLKRCNLHKLWFMNPAGKELGNKHPDMVPLPPSAFLPLPPSQRTRGSGDPVHQSVLPAHRAQTVQHTHDSMGWTREGKHTPSVPRPWQTTIKGLCLLGLYASLRHLTRSSTVRVLTLDHGMNM